VTNRTQPVSRLALASPSLSGHAQDMALLQHVVIGRPVDLTGQRRAELQEERIRLAQLRDDMPTWDELAVMLKVREEFKL
jgi:hypothetical protein